MNSMSNYASDLSIQRTELVKNFIHEYKNLPEFKNVNNGQVFEKFMDMVLENLSTEFIELFSKQELGNFIRYRFDFIEKLKEQDRLTVKAHRFDNEHPFYFKGKILVELFIDNCPFIIDSLIAYLEENELSISQLVHPIFTMTRDKQGKISNISKSVQKDDNKKVYIACLLKRKSSVNVENLEKEVKNIMETVTYVTSDFPQLSGMLSKVYQKTDEDSSESLKDSEMRHLFHWFLNGGIVVLGGGTISTDYNFQNLDWDLIETPLGLVRMKKEAGDSSFPSLLNNHVKHFDQTGLRVSLNEFEEQSAVHRRDKIQMILFKGMSSKGNHGITFFPAIFTDRTKREDALSIPLARLKVNAVIESKSYEDNGYSIKTSQDFFNILPKSELFRLEREELSVLYDQTLFHWERNVVVFKYIKSNRQYARITVSIPRKNFNEYLFETVNTLLNETFGCEAEMKYWLPLQQHIYTHHIYWYGAEHEQNFSEFDPASITEHINQLSRTWKDRLIEEIRLTGNAQKQEKRIIDHYIENYAPNFSQPYQSIHSPEEAFRDILYIEDLVHNKRIITDLRPDSDESYSRVKIYTLENTFISDLVPIFKNLSLIAVRDYSFELEFEGSKIWIYTFLVKHDTIQSSEFGDYRRRFRSILRAILEDRYENHSLNKLVTRAQLSKEEVRLFILYRNYLWQVGTRFSKATIDDSLINNPKAVRSLIQYFTTKFNPEQKSIVKGEAHLKKEKETVDDAIKNLVTVSEDLIFKNLYELMEATVRTNYYNVDEKSALAIKVSSREVEYMAPPKPLYEIFVYGMYIEAIHLRGGMIARGGIRHSDREDDFRTEILGLMKTQMMKNSVIVPVGSKGGFVTKKRFSSRDELMKEGEKQYRVYINSLLSITDNIEGGKIIPPNNVVRYDGDDPYLVVAADKGTAHLSDVANEISDERKFWLSDGFASGGTNGYSHKGVGITAKGAWECVKIHFLELGKDIQREEFSVIGIGDMAGDVFGNGMLLSEHIALKGAFNHMHIFLDPNPDVPKSYEERKRMFELPRSTWTDYNKELISKGGGIFERSAKSIDLSPEIQSMLGIQLESINPDELIRYMLKADVDLLWNGGIGTYVKSSKESNPEVGDQSNDNLRVNADELKAKVFGEGGNLGLTQRGRIEFAINGGKINADAIDNSAGVDMSDHEVNIKIMLDLLKDDQSIKSQEDRNKVLRDLCDEVTDQCLQDNIDQCHILSMDLSRSKKDISIFLSHIQFLTKHGLDTTTEKIPDETRIREYFNNKIGLPRPILTVLLSYTKIYLYNEVLNSKLPEDPILEHFYINYFPESLNEKYPLKNYQHRLKREIVATVLINKIINQAGITLIPYITSLTQRKTIDIIKGYYIVDHLLNAKELRNEVLIEHADKGSSIETAYRLLERIEQVVFKLTAKLLFIYPSEELELNLIEKYEGDFQEFGSKLYENLPTDDAIDFGKEIKKYKRLGLSSELAEKLSQLTLMQDAFEAIHLSRNNKLSLVDGSNLNQEINRLVKFHTLYNKLSETQLTTIWERKHKGILIQELYQNKISFGEHIHQMDGKNIEEKIKAFKKKNQKQLNEYKEEFQLFQDAGEGMSGIAFLIRFLHNI